MKRTIKLFLILCLICLLLPVCTTVFAAEEEVIQISTPEELDAIRDNLSGHYQLANDIDMSRCYSFEPIGNEMDGAFTGVLDGNGHTISNLDLSYDTYKYVGLFGYLDGTVQDLTLKNIHVEASRYGGGLAGYADVNSSISGITVSGSISAGSNYFTDYTGGVVGYSQAKISDCINQASVTGIDYTGGVVGYCTSNVSDSANNGTVNGKGRWTGGVVGRCEGNISECTNNMSVSNSNTTNSTQYIGGIAGGCDGNISGCDNYAVVTTTGYAGGIVCYCYGDLSDCVNDAYVSSSMYSAGIAYYASGKVSNCHNSGKVSSVFSAAGIVDYGATVISGCSNTGSIDSTAYDSTYGTSEKYSGHGIGRASILIENCYSSGLIKGGDFVYGIGIAPTIQDCRFTGRLSGDYGTDMYGIGDATTVLQSYCVATAYSRSTYSHLYLITDGTAVDCLGIVYDYTGTANAVSGTLNTSNGSVGYYSYTYFPTSGSNSTKYAYFGNYDLYSYSLEKIVHNFDSLDYELNWTRDENWSSGLPIPRGLPAYLELNEIVLILDRTETAQLKGRIGETEVSDLTWTSGNENVATVTADGLVTAIGASGTQTYISATTADGLRMDCLVLVSNGMPTKITISDTTEDLRIGQTYQLTATLDALASKNRDIIWSSSNTAVASVDETGLVTAHALGTATIRAKTANGKTASCTINVKYAQTLTIREEQIVVGYNQIASIHYTLTPADAQDSVSCSSSNTDYVCYYSSGSGVMYIQGYKYASTNLAHQTVTLTTTGGLSARVPVTVVYHSIPSSTSVNVNKTTRLTLTTYPNDFEQAITWTSSDETIATVDENGAVTGILPGAVTITATSEYGITQKCTLTVTNYANELNLDRTNIYMVNGTTDRLAAWMIPWNTTSTLSYASSNTSVVTVSNTGLLTAKGTGSAIITVTASGSGRKATCSVTIVKDAVPATALTLSNDTLALLPGERSIPKVTVSPANTTSSAITWTSSDESIATVAPGGIVTAVSGGTAAITAQLDNGLSCTCTVTVKSGKPMEISIQNVKACPGEVIEVPFQLDVNPGVAAMRLKITYDSSVLTPGAVIGADMLSGVTLSGNIDSDGTYYVLWSGAVNISQTGTMFAVPFTVSEDAVIGSQVDINASYEPGDICDEDHVELSPTLNNGSVYIREWLAGDVYEDEILNSHDILLLQQYLTELEEFTEHQKNLGDLDGDGSVSMKDIVLLAQKLINPSAEVSILTPDQALFSVMTATEASFKISGGSASVAENGTFSVPVTFAGCPGISAFKIHISYDESLFRLESIEGQPEQITAALMTNLEIPGNAIVTWYSNENVQLDGQLLTLNFKLLDSSFEGTSEIVFSAGNNDICDENLNSLDVAFENSTISPFAAPSIVTSGWSGDTTWVLTDDGVLTFSGDGNMKNYANKTAMPWYGYFDQITKVVIEEGVTRIGDYAFYGMPKLTAIEIPETVTIIGNYAFKGCPKLDNVVLPAGLTKLGESAFYECIALTSIEIPASLWTVQPYTFKNCTALESVTFHEGNLQKISDGAFYGTALTELVLPDCLDILDVYSFKNCASLASITIGSGLTEIREAAFYGTAISEITIPEGITKIGPYAFKNCVNLETISLPESLTSVGEASFYACTALKAVELPDNVTTIGNYAFRKCAAITSVNFGAELTTIGECSFYGCTGLTELVIPDKVTTIKPYAFKTCTGLTVVTLGSSVTTIGEGAFNTCTGLKAIVFPASLASIGDYCFSGSYNLWKLTFQGDAPTIGVGAFKGMAATAYYPSGNATWTDSVCQNYGGTVTWKAQ